MTPEQFAAQMNDLVKKFSADNPDIASPAGTKPWLGLAS